MKYVIGTRGSKLALAQTNWVKQKLEKAYPLDTFEIAVIKTKGDRIQDIALDNSSFWMNVLILRYTA